MDAAIGIEDLSKRYADVLAVDNLSFSVVPGAVCGLLGPNGAGKTTTLRMLVGLVRPTAGSASLLGARMRPSHPVLERVGSLIDRPGFVPHLNGMRNLKLFWRAGGDRWPAPGLERALEVAGLGTAINRKVKTYSQGMRQRLGIAQALLGAPEVLVLDEPTSGLDPMEMREIRGLLRTLSAGGTTVLLSSHLLTEVEQVCSHAVVMDRGHFVAAGTVVELIGARTSVYLEVDDLARARRVLDGLVGVTAVSDEPPGLSLRLDGIARSSVVAALVAGGVCVETVSARHQLEDAFLGLLAEESP